MKTLEFIITLALVVSTLATPNPGIDFQIRTIKINGLEIARIEAYTGWSVRDEGDGHYVIWKHDESFFLILTPDTKNEKKMMSLEEYCKTVTKSQNLVPLPRTKLNVFGHVIKKNGLYFVSGCTEFGKYRISVYFPNRPGKKLNISEDAATAFGFIKTFEKR